MNNVTATMETNLINLAQSFLWLNKEANDLYSYYWGTNVNTLISGLASGTTAATTASSGSLNKTNYQNGITLVTALMNFFGNSGVSTANYLVDAYGLINGSTPASSPVSNDVENIGSRLVILGNNCISYYKSALDLTKSYNSCGLSSIIGSIASTNVIFGCNLTQSKFVSSIVLMNQFNNLMGNSAVTTGDYLSTVSNLVMGS